MCRTTLCDVILRTTGRITCAGLCIEHIKGCDAVVEVTHVRLAMSGVYLGRGSAPSDGTGIGSVIAQHVGIHLLLQAHCLDLAPETNGPR